MAEKDWDLVKALVIGGLIGAGLGILFAPKSGRETREDLARKTDELLARVGEEFEKEDGRGRLAYEGAIDRLKKAEEKAVEKITDLTEKLSENKSRLMSAIDAGREAYREEKNKPRE
jgi:gas vesicle protein